MNTTLTAEDWFMTAFAVPLILLVGWVNSYRVWLRRADVGAGATVLTGEAGGAGYHAFLLPATMSFTCALSSIVLLALGFWLWRFTWPRVFVPPHMRGGRAR